LALVVGLTGLNAYGELVAGEDFDGGDVNMISGFDPSSGNIDGGPGDFFGVSSIGSWPQSAGVPFSLADDSVIDVSGGTRTTDNAFSGDEEGIFGQARDVTDAFFSISDNPADDIADQTASWAFDVSNYQNLMLKIDMGQQSDGDSFDGISAGSVVFTAQIDDGSVQSAFVLTPVDVTGGSFTFRAMDSGTVPTTAGVLEATGDNTVTKLLAEDGSTASNTYLDKTPASGNGAGQMDTFMTAIDGTGSELTLALSADVPFEAMAFDNIAVTGDVIPEPATLTLLAVGGAAVLRRRR